jgi:hypothetical protein
MMEHLGGFRFHIEGFYHINPQCRQDCILHNSRIKLDYNLKKKANGSKHLFT